MRKADLHIHTEASDDSILKPQQIFEQAQDVGLHAVAFTDHDGVGNIEAGSRLSGEYGVVFLPGIELCCSWRKQVAHVLGYFPEGVPHELEGFIEANIHGGTRKTGETLISRMAKHGIGVTVAEYHAEIEAGGMQGSPLCRLLIGKGIVRDVDDYVEQFGGEEYKVEECFYPAVTDVIAFLKATGSRAVLAHPGSRGRYGLCDMREDDVSRFAERGLDGIETYHPLHSDEDVAEYEGIAAKLNLVRTGGSDSHGRPSAHERVVGASFCDWDEIEDGMLGQTR